MNSISFNVALSGSRNDEMFSSCNKEAPSSLEALLLCSNKPSASAILQLTASVRGNPLLADLWSERTPKRREKLWIRRLTIRSNGSCVSAALSSSSLYSSSSHSLCRVLSGSLSCTGIVTLERSLPMLFRRMFHRLMVLLLGLSEGRQERRWQRTEPLSGDRVQGAHSESSCALIGS